MDLMTVCGTDNGGFFDGVAFVLLVLLLGAIPMAAACAALAFQRKSQWNSPWGGVFKAGFVFHASSLVLSAALFLLGAPFAISDWEAQAATVLLAANVLCSAFALRTWRDLSGAVVPERFLSVTG